MKTASWVIVCRESGNAIFETFNARTADAINKAKYEAKPVLEYLGELNRKIKADDTARRVAHGGAHA